jgi:hypothetical protein
MEEAAILRKIAALLARAEDKASSPAEVAHAIHIADKLMRRYNLSRDEVRLRQEEMRRSERVVSREDSDYANTIAVAIGRLAQCRTSGERGRSQDYFHFSGLRVDVDYAEWLFRASWAALRQGWAAYRTSPQHEQLIAKGHESAAIERHYKFGFSAELATRMKALAKNNADAAGQEIICLKNALIEKEFGPAKATSTSWELIKGNLHSAYRSGADASRKVGLRQTLEEARPQRLGDAASG